MFWLVFTIVCTLALSFICSLLEALILSTTLTEIEALKQSHPARGQRLEQLKVGMADTLSTILTLNTIANTLGSIIIGGLATRLYGQATLGLLAALLTLLILIFAEVVPKNLGMTYRRQLQPHVVYPLSFMRTVLRPISWVCNSIVRLFIRPPAPTATSDDELILLAQRGAREGSLSKHEATLIANALTLEVVRVADIMTPRTVVTALRASATVDEIYRDTPSLPFARIPLYGRNLDDITGLLRRRDLLKAKADGRGDTLLSALAQEIHFVPQTVSAANALQVLLKTHQQMLVVVDEFGSTTGVVSMEDVMEQLLGREIFEKDDLAVDMRELARARQSHRQSRQRPVTEGTRPPMPIRGQAVTPTVGSHTAPPMPFSSPNPAPGTHATAKPPSSIVPPPAPGASSPKPTTIR